MQRIHRGLKMQDEKRLIDTAIARGAHERPEVKDLATKGLVDFLREEIIEAEWMIVRAKAQIDAYQQAIDAIEKRSQSHQ